MGRHGHKYDPIEGRKVIKLERVREYLEWYSLEDERNWISLTSRGLALDEKTKSSFKIIGGMEGS